MIKIETLENSKYKFGYPYNDSIDVFFESLPESFINVYNLTDDEITLMHEFKNKVLELDRSLFKSLLEINSFIFEFNNVGKVLQDDYDELMNDYNALLVELDNLRIEFDQVVKTFDDYSNTISQFNDDIVKLDELVLYYSSKLVDNTYVYNNDYIDKTTSDLMVIDDVIDQSNQEYLYYKDKLKITIDEMISKLSNLGDYDFYQVSLKTSYEEWLKRPEDYYKQLVVYFKEEYDSIWTYGSSLMYDEHLEYVNISKALVEETYYIMRGHLFKNYSFKIEKDIKLYSLEWLENHETFEYDEFTIAIEKKKKEIIESKLIEIENIIASSSFALNSVISKEDMDVYYLYKEIVLEKRKYIYLHIDNITDDVLENYNLRIEELYPTYLKVENKLNQSTYWIYYYDLEQYKFIRDDLQRQITLSDLIISQEAQQTLNNNEEYVSKINFYTLEKDSLLLKIDDLIELKDKVEIEKNVYGDEITIKESKLFEMLEKKEELVDSYKNYFMTRLDFYINNIIQRDIDIYTIIAEGFNLSYVLQLDELDSTIPNNISWYDKDNKDKLFGYYYYILDTLKNNLSDQWEVEFNHEIYINEYIKIMNDYLNIVMLEYFAWSNKFLLDETFDNELNLNIDVYETKLISIFKELSEKAFKYKVNIMVKKDMFDYEIEQVFYIDNTLGDIESINKIFKGILDNIRYILVLKNSEYGSLIDKIEENIEINKIWDQIGV